MSKLFITADLHLGHRNICKYRTQFNTAKEHDTFVIDNYLSTVTKRDTVYFLGDIAFSKEAADLLDTLPGRKVLILGNHDTDRSGAEAIYLMTKFERVYGSLSKKHCWFTHIPIHSAELRDKPNIHGHVHEKTLDDWRYANVCLENCNYYPVDFQDIKKAFAAKKIFTGNHYDN